MWILAAVGSSLFAGLTAVLSKLGLKKLDSDVATALRTGVVLIFAWLMVFITGAQNGITQISIKSWIFLILSGLATGASWICYFKALSIGEVSKVAAVDKSSVVFSVLLAIIIFPEERNLWWLKLICLIGIGVGSFLMCEIKKGEGGGKKAWLLFAFLSAIFAALTSILAKIGIENVDSNLATALRTIVVFLLAWIIVFFKKKTHLVKQAKGKELIFLIASGIATGASWLCYYYALQEGQVSIVVPIDKLSILVTVIFSYFAFKEKLNWKQLCGLFLMIAGTVCMALFT